jgi:putative tricarboxylic transport membrane protein
MGNKREFAVGAVFLAIGLAYLYMTSTLPRKQFIDAAFVPYILSITMCLLGVLQMRAAGKRATGAAKEDDADYGTVSKTLGLIVAYVALLEPVGFPIMTIVYLFAQFIVLTPANRRINYPMYGVIACITSAAVYLTFRYAFDMILPVGLMNGLIE